LLPDDAALKRKLNDSTRRSTHFAVIVMRPEQKAAARADFDTPLVFSIQEVKGLEYENIIIYNFISSCEQQFRQITDGVSAEDLLKALSYARAKDKNDKSLEVFKFYINAFYVAVTRAIKNLYLIESKPKQRFLDLLDVQAMQDNVELDAETSSLEDWRNEANKLEMQGKQAQAEEIRQNILNQQSVPWSVLTAQTLPEMYTLGITENQKKQKILLFEYALVYQDQQLMNDLSQANFKGAKKPKKSLAMIDQKYYVGYQSANHNSVLRQIDQYGVNFRNIFNQTPTMIASRFGNASLIKTLTEMGADTTLVNNVGFNALHIALEQACVSPKFARQKLSGAYHQLAPDSLSVQVDEKLLKIDKRLMEFFMFNLMLSMFYTRLVNNFVDKHQFFTVQDFLDVIERLPESILPTRRKKRSYVSSILSKNECTRIGPYNRKLFYRTQRGNYILNPALSIRLEGEWCNLYALLKLDVLAYQPGTDQGASKHNDQRHSDHVNRLKTYISDLIPQTATVIPPVIEVEAEQKKQPKQVQIDFDEKT